MADTAHTAAAQGPAAEPRKYTVAERLDRFGGEHVDRMLRSLTANGSIADYDDEIANRINDAADLCVAAREANLVMADMLAALQAAERLYQDGILSTPNHEYERVHALRRAAIARATGK